MNNCILRFLLTSLYVMSFVRITVEANGQAEIFALYNAVVNIATSFCVFQTAVWWAPWIGYCASLSCSCISSSHYCWPTEETSGKPVNLQHSYFLCQTETKQHSMVTRKRGTHLISVYLWCCITSLLGVKAKQHRTQELDPQIKEMDPPLSWHDGDKVLMADSGQEKRAHKNKTSITNDPQNHSACVLCAQTLLTTNLTTHRG